MLGGFPHPQNGREVYRRSATRAVMRPTSIRMRTRSGRSWPPLKKPAINPARIFILPWTRPSPTGLTKRTALYHLPKRGVNMTRAEMVAMWKDFAEKYPIISIEDGNGRRRLGGLGSSSQTRWVKRSSSSATTCTLQTRNALKKGISLGP